MDGSFKDQTFSKGASNPWKPLFPQDHSTVQGMLYESFTDTVELRARLANISLSKGNYHKVVRMCEPEVLSSWESTRFLFC